MEPGTGAEGAEEFAAGDYAGRLGAMCRRRLEEVGHTGCPYLEMARYVPESAAVVCGCGAFAEAPEVAEDPPADVMVAGHVPAAPQDPLRSSLALIDPTQIYTPEQVEQHILDTLYRLETGALFERECIRRAEAAVAAFDRVYYATIHTSDQTSELKRKAEAEVECDQRGLTAERNEAKMMLAAVKATMHNLRAVLSGYQSTARSISVAYQGGGSPGRF